MKKKGQALVALLVFMVIAITITSGAVTIVTTNTLATQKLQQGVKASMAAESGAENALLRLLRDPGYTGETMPVGDGTATITITTVGSTKTITSTGTNNNFVRKIQVVADYSNNTLTIVSWQEIP